MMGVPQVLAHGREDNVAVVVVENLTAGTRIDGVVTGDNSDFSLVTVDAVPIGHKVALRDMTAGDTIIKYGEDIGRLIADVAKGGHVHVHNLKTKRW